MSNDADVELMKTKNGSLNLFTRSSFDKSLVNGREEDKSLIGAGLRENGGEGGMYRQCV